MANGTALGVGGNSSMLDGVAVFAQAANKTAQALAKAAVEEVRTKIIGEGAANSSGGFEWVRGLMGRKEWRVPCLDVLVRL